MYMSSLSWSHLPLHGRHTPRSRSGQEPQAPTVVRPAALVLPANTGRWRRTHLTRVSIANTHLLVSWAASSDSLDVPSPSPPPPASYHRDVTPQLRLMIKRLKRLIIDSRALFTLRMKSLLWEGAVRPRTNHSSTRPLSSRGHRTNTHQRAVVARCARSRRCH
jgi:hypothetical protein